MASLLSEQISLLKDVSTSLQPQQDTEVLRDAMFSINTVVESQKRESDKIEQQIKELQLSLEVAKNEVESKIKASSTQEHLEKMTTLEEEKIRILQKSSELEANHEALKSQLRSLSKSLEDVNKESQSSTSIDSSVLKLSLFRSLGVELIRDNSSTKEPAQILARSSSNNNFKVISTNLDDFELTESIWEAIS